MSLFIPQNVRLVTYPNIDCKDGFHLEVFPLDVEAKDIGLAWKFFKKKNEYKLKKGIFKIVDMENQNLKNLVLDARNIINNDPKSDWEYFLWEGLTVRVKRGVFNQVSIKDEDNFVFAFNGDALTFLNTNDPLYQKSILSSSFINNRRQLLEKERTLSGLTTDGYVYTDGQTLYHCIGEKDFFKNSDLIQINLNSLGLMLNKEGHVYLDVNNLNNECLKKVAIPLGDVEILLGDLSSVKKIPSKLDVTHRLPANAICTGKTVSDLLKFIPHKSGEEFETLREHAYLDRANYLGSLKHDVSWTLVEDDDLLEKSFKDNLKKFTDSFTCGEFNIMNIYVFGRDRGLYMVELNVYQASQKSEVDVSFGVYKVFADEHKIIKGFNSEMLQIELNSLNMESKNEAVDKLYNAIFNKALSEDLNIKKAMPQIVEKTINANRFFGVAVKPLKYKS